jgi:hypothetical protein
MKKLFLILILFSISIIGACTVNQQNANQQGILILKLTDNANQDYSKVLVTISTIEVNKDGNWTVFSEQQQTFDLLTLENVAMLLGQQQLDAGKYTQIRLSVDKAKVQLIGNDSLVDAKVPSDKIKLVKGFTIEEGKDIDLFVNIIGRDTVRVGRQQSYTLIYGNLGDVDADWIICWIEGIPEDADVEFKSKINLPTTIVPEVENINWNDVPIEITTSITFH